MLGGLAMGLSREEIERRIPEIQEYSGLGDAMGRPMNTYSSGMTARLLFSIATLRVPEVLLIDEALAVGDKQFRRRSLRRIREIRDEANTVVMVSHSLNQIRNSCNRVVWLEQGELVADGDVDEILDLYSADPETENPSEP